MNAERVLAIAEWENAQRDLQRAIERELNARLALVQMAFPNPVEGTLSAELGDGRVLKATFRNNYNLDSKRVEEIQKALPRAVGAATFKWKAELSLTGYKALEPAHKLLVNDILTIKQGRPALEIVTPKVA